MPAKKSKSTKKKTKKKSPPKTLHCGVKGCTFVTHSGIKGIGAHYRKKHPSKMKRKN